MTDQVLSYLAERYADNQKVQDCLIDLYQQYDSWGVKDNKFNQDFTDGRDEHFYPYVWEMLLARHLKNIGLEISSEDEGPDFKIDYQGQTIWIEAVCPSPEGLPEHWLNLRSIEDPPMVFDVPHEQMLLRWTAALKEKRNKLTGYLDRNGKPKIGYFDKGTVEKTEPYVIAINASRLGFGNVHLHYSISQKPFALEAAFPFGAIEIVIDRESGDQIDQRHVYRASIKNLNGADVPTDSFLNPEYAGVSAIIGTPAGINAVCGEEAPMALVHNPLATNKLPIGILGADEEYIAEVTDTDIEIRMVTGADDNDR